MAEPSLAEQELKRLQTMEESAVQQNGALCLWKYHKPTISDGQVKIECLCCGKLLTTSNPNTSMISHFGGYSDNRSRLGIEKARNMVFVAGYKSLKRQMMDDEDGDGLELMLECSLTEER